MKKLKKGAVQAAKLLFSLLLLMGSYELYKMKIERPYLTIIGPVEMADGIGRQSVEIMDALKDYVSIGFIKTHMDKRLSDVPSSVKKIIRRSNKNLGKVVILEEVLVKRGDAYRRLETPPAKDQIKIAYSMFESTRIPTEWPLILNTYFDMVVVPDPHLVEVYQQSGVTLPIFVLPLGINLNPYLDCPIKTARHTPFVFGNLGNCINRKNQLLLIRAFHKAFGNSPDVLLKINARGGDPYLLSLIKQEIRTQDLQNIQFTNLSLKKYAYLKLFSSIDCYVSPSKGEGFSIQPREAMALGIPVIATDNSAQKTLCASDLVKGVPCPIKEPAFYEWAKEGYGEFSTCSVDALAAALKEVYEHYPLYLSKAQTARTWATNYNYDHLKPLYQNLVKPRKILLGEENKITAEYLMTNSKELYEKYQSIR